MDIKLFKEEMKIGSRLYCNVYENGFEETINIIVIKLKKRLWLFQDDENDVYIKSAEVVFFI